MKKPLHIDKITLFDVPGHTARGPYESKIIFKKSSLDGIYRMVNSYKIQKKFVFSKSADAEFLEFYCSCYGNLTEKHNDFFYYTYFKMAFTSSEQVVYFTDSKTNIFTLRREYFLALLILNNYRSCYLKNVNTTNLFAFYVTLFENIEEVIKNEFYILPFSDGMYCLQLDYFDKTNRDIDIAETERIIILNEVFTFKRLPMNNNTVLSKLKKWYIEEIINLLDPLDDEE